MINLRLKELRKTKNVTQKQVAEAINITERNYQSFEYGNTKPNYNNLIALADFFGVSIDYLVGRENYWTNADGNIAVKVPADIFNLDTDALKKKLGQE